MLLLRSTNKRWKLLWVENICFVTSLHIWWLTSHQLRSEIVRYVGIYSDSLLLTMFLERCPRKRTILDSRIWSQASCKRRGELQKGSRNQYSNFAFTSPPLLLSAASFTISKRRRHRIACIRDGWQWESWTLDNVCGIWLCIRARYRTCTAGERERGIAEAHGSFAIATVGTPP